jgi:hypothetical protein
VSELPYLGVKIFSSPHSYPYLRLESDFQPSTQVCPLPSIEPLISELCDDGETLFGRLARIRCSIPNYTLHTALQSFVTGPIPKQAMASSNRASRLRTNLAVQSRTASASAEAIATGIFRSISRNLEEYGFNRSCLRLHDFQWLLPKSGSIEQQLSIFHALHDCPMAVPNDDLVRILELELCTKTSPATPPGTHFYIHSFELTRHQLEQVMEFMAEQGVLLSKAVQAEITCNLHDNQTQPCSFTIRYVAKYLDPEDPSIVISEIWLPTCGNRAFF